MYKQTIPGIIFLLVGCDLFKPIDPCADGSPLAPEGSQVAADCQQCGQSPCPDETGETGEDSSTELTCDSYGLLNGAGLQFCFVGNLDIPITNPNFNPYIHKDKTDCSHLSAEFKCDRTWQGEGDAMCVLCQAEQGAAGPKPPATDNTGWRLCDPVGFGSTPANPATVDDLPGAPSGWIDDLTCSEYTDPGFACPLEMIAVDQPQYEHNGKILYSEFTCTCDGSDDTCQPGAVCEAGWIIDGLYPRPTICIRDGANIPAGPEVYGLTAWGDGIEIDDNNIVLSPGMLLTLVPRDGHPFALLNDDQRVDTRGTITHCGVNSLCAYLGLHVGERLVLDRFSMDDLLLGEATYIEVARTSEQSRWLTVAIE